MKYDGHWNPDGKRWKPGIGDVPSASEQVKDLGLQLKYVPWQQRWKIHQNWFNMIVMIALPSGKRLHNYGKSPFYSWVNQLQMAMVNSQLFAYQRVQVLFQSALIFSAGFPASHVMFHVTFSDGYPDTPPFSVASKFQ